MRRTIALTTVMIGGLLLSGCEWTAIVGSTVAGWSSDVVNAAINLGAWRHKTPEVAGNTFRSSEDEKATRAIITFETEFAGAADYKVGQQEAMLWLFADRRLGEPEFFVQLHRIPGAKMKEFGSGDLAESERAVLVAQDYCIVWKGKTVPEVLVPYLAPIASKKYAPSSDIMIRRFTENADRKDIPYRVDIVYIEDIVRRGYTCGELGDLKDPDSKETKAFIDGFRLRAMRAFLITG